MTNNIKYQVVYLKPKKKSYSRQVVTFYSIEDASYYEQNIQLQGCKETEIIPLFSNQIMNRHRFIAGKAYSLYMSNSRQQLSPQDALWHTDQYLEVNPNCTDEEAIDGVVKSLIEGE